MKTRMQKAAISLLFTKVERDVILMALVKNYRGHFTAIDEKTKVEFIDQRVAAERVIKKVEF